MPSRRQPLTEISNNDVMSSPGATVNSRRKSGRATKAPEKFDPEAPSFQTENGNAKRKRGAATRRDQHESAEEEGFESEDDAEEESVDEEELLDQRRRARNAKKPAAKKAKINGNASQSHATTRLPSRPLKARKIAIADDNATGLYADVFTSGKSQETVVLDWLKRYDDDNPAAMVELVNLVLRSAGCDSVVTEDDINDPDNAPSKLNDLQEEEKGRNVADYPLIAKAKSGNTFRASLVDFFQLLIQTMHDSGVLYSDIALIENIHLWITTMTSSYLRPFRHTACLIALSLASALCAIAARQSDTDANTLRQLENERKKKASNKGRLAEFQKKIEEGKEHREINENTIRDFFDTVFVHRYRDVDAKIRVECVEALGYWILTLPHIFFEGTYLRYLGWMLSDISAPTRQEVLSQLVKIMRKAESIGRIRQFIDRFRPRIVEMASQDAEVGVRVLAIDLLDKIRQAGMLEPNDIDAVGKLIFDREVRVRKAVVTFFAENMNDLYELKIEELGGEDALEDFLTNDEDDYESPNSAWIKLKSLVELFLDYDESEEETVEKDFDYNELYRSTAADGAESKFSVAAQTLFDKLTEVRDWEVLAGYLLYDHSASTTSATTSNDVEHALKLSFKLEEREEAILLDMLYTSVKLNLTQNDDHERHGRKRVTKADLKQLQEDTAQRLALIIPRLFKKFSANPITTAAVLRLGQVLNLGVFQQLRQDSTSYANLLQQIATQFSDHSDIRVLTEASAALLHAKAFDDLEEVTEEQLQTLWDTTCEHFRKLFPRGLNGTSRGDRKVDELLDLLNAVKRLSKLTSLSNPVERFETKPPEAAKEPRQTVIEMLFECVGRGELGGELDDSIDTHEDKLVSYACQASLFYVMWKIKSLQESMKSSEDVSETEIDHLKNHIDVFMGALVSVFSSRAGLDDLRLHAAGTLLDLYSLTTTAEPERVLANKEAGSKYTHVHTLIEDIEPKVQQELTNLFTQLERSYSRFLRKPLEPPEEDEEPEDSADELDADEYDDRMTDVERRDGALIVESQLCDLTGKLVIAIQAGILDNDVESKLRRRLQRNRLRLGPNFKQVLGFLGEPSSKSAKKTQRNRIQQIIHHQKRRASVDSNASKDPSDYHSDEAYVDDELIRVKSDGRITHEAVPPEDPDELLTDDEMDIPDKDVSEKDVMEDIDEDVVEEVDQDIVEDVDEDPEEA